MAVGSLRVIAGEFRGRRLAVPPGERVRPTGDRAREALFSILAGRTEGAAVLDAFAGSGALGIEALSRGAREVVFLESDPGVLAVLRANLAGLGLALPRARVVSGPAEESLRRGRAGGPFDLVLADPPYGLDLGPRFLAAVAPALAPGALVVLEREARDPSPGGEEAGLARVRTARYGRAALDFYRRAGEAA